MFWGDGCFIRFSEAQPQEGQEEQDGLWPQRAATSVTSSCDQLGLWLDVISVGGYIIILCILLVMSNDYQGYEIASGLHRQRGQGTPQVIRINTY